jgi:CHAT domain-containing protein
MASLEVVTPSGQSLSDVLSRQALKELERGQAIPAVALLEEAVIEEPLNSAILNNLAAAHVAKAFSENSPIDLIYAFSAADKASVLNPRLMPASLNKSLVLHCLSLNWSDAGASQESIKRDLRAFSRDGQLERLAEAVSRYPRIARILAESDLLGEWAVARVQHQNSMAEEKLRTLMRIANSLRQATGDKFLEDVVHGLTRGGARVASGFILYYAGRQAYSVGDYDRASRLFRRSTSALIKSGSPFALRSYFSLGCSLHFQAQNREALEIFERSATAAKDRSYRALQAEELWMQGLVRFAISDFGQSEEAYGKSLLAFSGMREVDSAAGVHALLAENLDYEGVHDKAWRHCFDALRNAPEISDPLRLYQIYSVAATVAFHAQVPSLALILQDRAVVNARNLNNPIALSAALSWRARYKLDLGRLDEARKDVQEARGAVSAINGRVAKARALGDLLFVDSDLSGGRAPAETIKSLTQAQLYLAAADARYQQIEILLARARIYRSMGLYSSAINDLKNGMDIAERRREAIPEDAVRISFLDRERTLYNEAGEVSTKQGNYAQTLEYFERGRARAFLDLLGRVALAGSGKNIQVKMQKSMDLTRVCRMLPPDTYILYYTRVHGLVWVFLIGHSGLLKSYTVVADDVLRREVGEFVRSLPGHSDQVMQPYRGPSLYSLIINKSLTQVPRNSMVIIIPDSFLDSLPFAALREPLSGRLVLQDYIIGYAPSVLAYMASLSLAKMRSSNDASKAVLIGDPAFDRVHFPGLVRLTNAAAEERIISKLYPHPVELNGELATKNNFVKEVGNADVISYAGHLIVNQEDSLSSFLLMAPEKEMAESGRLYTKDIYDLTFHRARVVVLSACQGGAGMASESEGILSVARAFLAAGAPAVLSAFWNVNDRVAESVSVRFHEQLSHGLAAALRSAQVQCLKEYGRYPLLSSDCLAFEIQGGLQG